MGGGGIRESRGEDVKDLRVFNNQPPEIIILKSKGHL